MPQPILSLVSNPNLRLDPRTLIERPNVAVRVAQCIAHWSWVETQVAALFVALLGPKSMASGAELYNEMDSARVKDRSIRSVALSVLTGPEYDFIEALLSVVKTHQRTRDKLAHWYWGVCNEITDGLIVVDPKYLTRQRAELLQLMAEGKKPAGDFLGFDLKHFLVFREAELESEAERFGQLAVLVGKFNALVRATDQNARDQQRLSLSTDALIREALRRQSEDQNNPPTAPRQRRR